MTGALAPFTPRATDAQLEDLRARLRATRWPDAPQGAGWALGADVGELRALAGHWADGYDWRAHEAALAPRFRVAVGDVELVFVHVRAAAEGALPLLLCHGWPDSSWRFERVIGLLTDPAAHGADPADAFAVVVPDMPGYGWSPAPAGAPPDSVAVAGRFAELMRRLGHERYGAAGGDIGSAVTRWLGTDHAEHVVGVHRTDAGVPVWRPDSADLAPEERTFLAEADAWLAAEGAYAAMHRTKPQTAAVGLTDSPAGLLAWMAEKLRAWSDDDGALLSREDVLTITSIYWLTGTIGSSMRMYAANAALPVERFKTRMRVPTGYALYPGDTLRPPRAWLERQGDVARLSEPARGGHFAPVEDPEGYAQELRDFFRPLRRG